MNKVCALFLFFIPHPINGVVRRLLGQKISKTAKIHIFSFLYGNSIELGDKSVISPLTLLKANTITIGRYAHIAPFAIINAPLILGASFELGDHSRVFPFCWLEPGEGIRIGRHVGIGGHTLIFTHGSWTNYLHGGPVSFGPVVIEDHVWLPWRVFILPGVTIGKYSIIGASSTVTSSIPAHSLAAGSPAKVIKSEINMKPSKEILLKRIGQMMDSYFEFVKRNNRPHSLNLEQVYFFDSSIGERAQPQFYINIDFELLTYSCKNKTQEVEFFVSFLRRFGLRLEEKL